MPFFRFNNRNLQTLLIYCVSLFYGMISFATPSTITFQSRIIKPDGKALENSAVSFRFSLTDALGTCVIFQEDFVNQNMTGTKGLINLSLGGGTKVFPAGPLTMFEAFNSYNNPTISCAAGGTVNPAANDIRKLVVQFNDGTGWQTLPAMSINAIPFAIQAMSAQRLGDYPATAYVRTALVPTCVGGEALHFNGTSFTCVLVGGGSGTVTSVTSANADISVATTTTTPVLTLNAGTGANQIVKLNGTSQLPAVSGANLTNLNASSLASGTVPAAQMPALTGDVTMTAGTTATTLANNAVSNTHVAAAAAIARSKLASGTANHVVVNDGSGVMGSLGCANGEVLKFAAGAPVCGADIAGIGDIINGGNTTGAAVVVGTNDAQSLQFETNNAPAMTILSGGNVGIGTVAPAGILDVRAGTASAGNHGTNVNIYAQNANVGAGLGGNIILQPGNGFNPGGNGGVGIGISDPNLNPVLYGQSTDAGILNVGGGTEDNSYSAGRLILTNTRATPGSSDELGTISFASKNNGTFSERVKAKIEAVAQGSSGGASGYGGALTFTTKPDNGVPAERMRIIGSGNVGIGGDTTPDANLEVVGSLMVSATSGGDGNRFIVNSAGNVGIGTTTPARLFHVAGPMRMTPAALPGSPAAGDFAFDSGDANKLKYYDGSSWIVPGVGAGSVTSVTSANSDIGVATTTSTPVLTLNSGTTGGAGDANKIAKLDAGGLLTAAMIPNLDTAIITSGTLAAARMPALTGDVTTSAGAVATTIAADAVTSAKILNDEIVNADINSAAAIARTKLAAGSNDHVLINTAGGVMSSEAQLAVTRGGTGLGSYTNNALIMANVTGTALTNATCATGEILMWNVTTWSCTSMASSAQGYFKDGGNTFTGTATIGTNSNHNLEIETNSTTKMTVLASGNVGIGTATPSTTLDVNGAVTLRQGYYESVGDLGSLGCGSTNITGFTTNIYNLTACSSGTTTLNIPTITGWPAGNMSWVVSFFVTGATSSVFNVSYNSSTAAVFWDKNSTGGSGGNNYTGFSVPSGSTDVITCSVVNTSSVKVFCGVSAQY